jgi:hypothetical protein
MITSRKEEVGVALQKYFLRFLEASGRRHMMHNFRRGKVTGRKGCDYGTKEELGTWRFPRLRRIDCLLDKSLGDSRIHA